SMPRDGSHSQPESVTISYNAMASYAVDFRPCGAITADREPEWEAGLARAASGTRAARTPRGMGTAPACRYRPRRQRRGCSLDEGLRHHLAALLRPRVRSSRPPRAA